MGDRHKRFLEELRQASQSLITAKQDQLSQSGQWWSILDVSSDFAHVLWHIHVPLTTHNTHTLNNDNYFENVQKQTCNGLKLSSS